MRVLSCVVLRTTLGRLHPAPSQTHPLYCTVRGHRTLKVDPALSNAQRADGGRLEARGIVDAMTSPSPPPAIHNGELDPAANMRCERPPHTQEPERISCSEFLGPVWTAGGSVRSAARAPGLRIASHDRSMGRGRSQSLQVYTVLFCTVLYSTVRTVRTEYNSPDGTARS